MAPKPPRMEKVVVKETALEEEVVVKKLKYRGVHPILPKVGSEAQAELRVDLIRMRCVGLMDHPWSLKRMQLLKELKGGLIPSKINGKI